MSNCKNVLKSICAVLSMCVIFSVVGCASILSKSQYPVTINSNPSGATVCVKNTKGVVIHKAVTPATIPLKASDGFFNPADYTFEFQKEGYLQGSTGLSAGMDPWYIGNIIFGGLIGIVIVDPATGAMWKLNDAVYGTLSKDQNFQSVQIEDITPTKTLTEAKPADRLKELKELKDSGVLTSEEYETKRRAAVQML